MNLRKLITVAILASSLFAACNRAPAPIETLASPTVAAVVQSTALPYPSAIGPNDAASAAPYPASPEQTSAPLPTSYPPVQVDTPAAAGPVTLEAVATQAPVASPDIYTCALQGTQLPVWKYKVTQTYHHDSSAYTQGLIFRDGVLYEGTGLRGRSTLRKVDLKTGEVLQSIDLPEQFFGEGIVELNGKLYQITWQERTGFIYDFTTLKKLDEFSYPTEGWGLTHDGSRLIMSDGTDQLYFINPATLEIAGQVAVADDRGPVYRINELEYVDGELWGNIYQTACIARIDPSSGKVTGWIDLTGLHGAALQEAQGQVPPEVPNGIAYDLIGKRIFITGKFWPTLFEITLEPAEARP